MVQVRWTNAAMDDLGEVRDYARTVSAGYAESLVERLIARTDALTGFPRLGRMVPEYADPAVRELLDGNYRVMYELINEERIDILRIHPTARPLPER